MSDFDISQFTELNTEELHLVGDAANRFVPLVAKGAATSNEQPVIKASDAVGLLNVALSRMAKAADDAERAGNHWRAQEIRQERVLLKMQLAEQNRQANPHATMTRHGPGMVPIFKEGSTHSIGEDRQVGGM